jgi:AcrR family transcriptional regulator
LVELTQKDRGGGREQAILRAAEQVFAERSYEGASIRIIAATADVNPALVGYYFGTKAELYREIFARRYHDITEERLRCLDAVPADVRGEEGVSAILDAWFRPFFARLDSPDGANFVRLLTREAHDPRQGERDIVSQFLNPSATRCMERLAAALPDATSDDIAWGYQFCIAVMLSSVAGVDRAAALASVPLASAGETDLRGAMVEYASAGLMALVARHVRR